MTFARNPLHMLMPLIFPTVLLAQSVPPSAAADYLEMRAQTIEADAIILCSSMPNLSSTSLRDFAQVALNTPNVPDIISGDAPFPEQGGTTVYAYFGFSEKAGQNLEIGACLNAFPPQAQSYSEILGEMAEGIGAKPSFLPHPERYTPVVAKRKAIYENETLVVLYLGLAGSQFPHVSMAQQYLFGLPDTYAKL